MSEGGLRKPIHPGQPEYFPKEGKRQPGPKRVRIGEHGAKLG